MRLQPRFCLSVCRRYLLILGSCSAQAESNRTIRGSTMLEWATCKGCDAI